MKITIEIPDRFAERKLLILGGLELIASKEPDKDFWLIKEVSCNLCGECCMDNPNTPFGVDNEGRCNQLIQYGDTWECGASYDRPFSCLGDPKGYDVCSITHRRVKA